MPLLPLVAFTFANFGHSVDTSHMSIEFNGSKSGDADYTVNSDGMFAFKATLAIQTIKLEEEVTGIFKNGKVTEYASVNSTPTGKVSVTYKGTHFTLIQPNGKKVETEYDFSKSGAIFVANLVPQSWKPVLQKVNFDKKEKQSVKVFLAESGSEIPVAITPGLTKKVAKGTAKNFKLSLGPLESEMSIDADGSVIGFDVPAQKLRWIADGWSDLFVDPFAKFPELSQATFGIKRLDAQTMTTRDGVKLVQDVLLPDKPGKYPTVLLRTPYGRVNDAINESWLVAHGYAVVTQDCRGRGASDGAWDPFVNERKDGYDTIDWISRQPWSDGNVGMIGGSYGGLVQWSAAVERHPALKCIIPQVSPPDAMHNIPYENGTFMLYGCLWWARIVEGKNADLGSIKQSLPHPDKLLSLPLTKVDDEAMGRNIPFFDLWLNRYKKSDWKGFDYNDVITKVKIPVLHISGWWDGDQIGTKMNFAALRAAKHTNQWLVYGPWVHAFNTNKSFGGVEYGDKAIIDLDSVFLRFFDTYLKGKSVSWEKQPHVRAFFTGSNQWVDLSDWPDSKKSNTTRLYFSAPNGALGSKKVGSLVASAEAAKGKSTYTYDPSKETVSKAFSDMEDAKSSTILNLDEGTSAKLAFETKPYVKPTRVGGPITVTLSFSTKAKDTDFFAFLVDVDEKGVGRYVGLPGKVRASYLADLNHPGPVVPGKDYTATIPLWDTAHEFRAGHKLGIFLTSSMFPNYARNLGLGEPPARATRMIKQVNTINHSGAKLSFVEFQTYPIR